MIRRAVIVVCLLLAIATFAVGLLSYRKEIICHGRAQGVDVTWRLLPRFASQKDFLELKTSPRISFVDGAFQHIWITPTAAQAKSEFRQINARILVWRRSSIIFIRPPGGNRSSGNVFSGLQLNQIGVQLWVLLLLFLFYPVLTSIRGPLRRHRRRKRGLCHNCGYNLTANTTGTCPECGKPSTLQ